MPGGGVEITPAPNASECSTRFELHDDTDRFAWDAVVPTDQTATLYASPPSPSMDAGGVLLLTADVSCVDAEGGSLGDVHLSGIRVSLDEDGSLVDLGPPPRHEDGILIDAPLGTWTVSTSRPGFVADDDVPHDIDEVAP